MVSATEIQMTSFNPQIAELHQAYCEATAYEVAMLPPFERAWFEALKLNITGDDVRLVVKSRMRGIALGERRGASIYLRNLIGCEEMLAEFMMELAAIRAMQRKRVFEPGKVEVLRATSRPDEPESPDAKMVSEIMNGMRRAAQ